ncbi:MAG: hypothetical protein V3W11_07765, partial [bacterium]
EPTTPPGKKEASITLTADQAKSVADARGSVKIQLTSKQVEQLKGAVGLSGPGDPRIPGTLTLDSSHIRTNNVVLVSMEISAERVSMDPQPSP